MVTQSEVQTALRKATAFPKVSTTSTTIYFVILMLCTIGYVGLLIIGIVQNTVTDLMVVIMILTLFTMIVSCGFCCDTKANNNRFTKLLEMANDEQEVFLNQRFQTSEFPIYPIGYEISTEPGVELQRIMDSSNMHIQKYRSAVARANNSAKRVRNELQRMNNSLAKLDEIERVHLNMTAVKFDNVSEQLSAQIRDQANAINTHQADRVELDNNVAAHNQLLAEQRNEMRIFADEKQTFANEQQTFANEQQTFANMIAEFEAERNMFLKERDDTKATRNALKSMQTQLESMAASQAPVASVVKPMLYTSYNRKLPSINPPDYNSDVSELSF